ELERAPQVLLAAGLDQRVGLRRHQRVEEPLDPGWRLASDDLGDHGAVAERLHGRDALDPERGGDARVRIRVELGERHLARARGDGGLEDRGELAARPAPLGPEVDHHAQLAGALDDVLLEGGLGRVEDHASRLPTRWLTSRWSGPG